MSKVLKTVSRCDECWHNVYNSLYKKACRLMDDFNIGRSQIADGRLMPDWCPLPDDNSEALMERIAELEAEIIHLERKRRAGEGDSND